MKIVRPRNKQYSVCLTNGLCVRMADFDDDQIEALKDSLTFDNPAYATTKRFSPYSRVAVDPMISYYHSSCGYLHIPAGSDLSPLNDPPVLDKRISVCADTVPEFVLKLREDQQTAADNYIKMNRGTKLRGAVQLPTGKGKTILALYLAAKLGMKTLVLVHKDDLVKGWQKDIALAFNNKCHPGLIKAKKRVVGEFITIATVQTLSRMDAVAFSELKSKFGMIIMDEMHHCPASMFSIVSEFTSRYRLGLTATAERKDGLAHVMKLYFGDFCYKYKATSDEKDILPVEVIRRNADFLHIDPLCKKVDKRWILVDPRTDPNSYKLKKDEEFISQVPYKVRPKIVFSEYSDLIVRLLRDFILNDVVSEYKQGHSCIVFFSQKQQIDDFADYLYRYLGVPRSHILKYYGDNNEKQNEETLIQAEQNRQRITLATYSKATEGTNVKRWEVEFLAGSLNDGKNVEQAVGRIRRTTKEPKLKVARVYDYRCPYVYSISSHAATRDARYRKLGFTFINDPSQSTQTARVNKEKPALFTRGYSH